MHKVATAKMKLKIARVSVLHDVLEPVHTLLNSRDNPFEIQVICVPDELTIETDVIRLRQIMVNLAFNSRKFVQKGFIRLGAQVRQDNKVLLYVQDSGPGIPMEKRNHLFQKYQESLDLLSQGTGMGLCLCKNLCELLGGILELDESYHSGIAGRPGAAFVIKLSCSPISLDAETVSKDMEGSNTILSLVDPSNRGSSSPVATALEQSLCTPEESSLMGDTCSRVSGDCSLLGSSSVLPESNLPNKDETVTNNTITVYEPPENMTVLFVDDDSVLRRLMMRTIKRVAPTWDLYQAANGETALRIVDDTDRPPFDLIFMDQYMASTEKQLLGTEAVRELRAKGVTARIVGLSANDMEEAFISAGADAFLQKPIATKNEEIRREIKRILS
eukprot:scaffold795_cov187-Amphora_coffeaeformis.AAC.5